MSVYAHVERRDNESFDQMMRRFHVQVENSGLTNDIKKHAYYVAPAERKRLKREAAKKRQRMEERKKNRYYED